jgi:hypothetical protein
MGGVLSLIQASPVAAVLGNIALGMGIYAAGDVVTGRDDSGGGDEGGKVDGGAPASS